MSIGDIQLRIAAIQSSIAALTPGAVSGGSTVKTTAAGAPAAGSSAVQFAAALQEATLDRSPTPNDAWIKPVNGRVTSEFGPRWGTLHAGIDIAAATGTPVRAMGEGTVIKAGWNGGYGNLVAVDHGNGVVTRYAHNSEVDVKVGQRVKAGDVISKAGSTGDSTGPHLHLEVQVNGKKVDPSPWMKEHGISL